MFNLMNFFKKLYYKWTNQIIVSDIHPSNDLIEKYRMLSASLQVTIELPDMVYSSKGDFLQKDYVIPCIVNFCPNHIQVVDMNGEQRAIFTAFEVFDKKIAFRDKRAHINSTKVYKDISSRSFSEVKPNERKKK